MCRDEIQVWTKTRTWVDWRPEQRAYVLQVEAIPNDMMPLVGRTTAGRLVFWPRTDAPLVDSRGDALEEVPEEIAAAVWRLRREIMIDTTRRREQGARR